MHREGLVEVWIGAFGGDVPVAVVTACGDGAEAVAPDMNLRGESGGVAPHRADSFDAFGVVAPFSVKRAVFGLELVQPAVHLFPPVTKKAR